MNVIKRNGKEVPFDASKINIAVHKANNEVPESERLSDKEIEVITERVTKQLEQMKHAATIEQIQDLVIHAIMRQQAFTVAQVYTVYRYKQQEKRRANSTDDAILTLIEYENEEVKQENSNKNPILLPTQRDYMAGEVSKDLTNRKLLTEDIVKAHKEGLIHFHDSDYFIQHMYNCCLINMEDVLQNGTVISNVKIDKPNSLATACNVATQVVAQTASSQYGGQTFSLAHIAPFVDISRQKWITRELNDHKALGKPITIQEAEELAENRLKDEIKAGVQTIQYQLVTLMTTNGQTPFVSLYMYLNEAPEGRTRDDLALLIEEVLKQRYMGLKNEIGEYVPAAFPKLLYVLDENNTYEGSQYYYLTELAAKCSAKTMVPDYISAKKMRELKGDVYPCMGCRSFLTPDRFTDAGVKNISNAKNYQEGKHKYYGRFNQGVVTINLVDVACSSNRDEDLFWKIFDERLELCHRALRLRHERLKGTTADVAPILWRHGVIARLNKGDVIDPLLYDGYSTISLGYAGLYEMTYYMTGHSHTSPEGKPFAIKVMQYMNDKCKKWKTEENIDYSLYGTPIESTTYKFAKALQNRFGIIPEVTDHNYITNSYHVNVREEIDAFTKLDFEAEFQALSPGGCISYVEVPNMQMNLEAVIKIIQHIYENIMYAEINTKSDFCQKCGYNGEIEIVEDENKKLIWKCPNCGNTDQNKMNVIRRTCGYLGTQFWNQGRTQEIRDRVLHTSQNTYSE